MADAIATTTPPVRISYPNLFKPKTFSKGSDEEPKYSVILLFNKADPAAREYLNSLYQIVNQLIIDKWPDPANRPRNPIVGNEFSPIKDADVSAGQKDRIPVVEKNPEYAGHWIISTSNRDKPDVFDENNQAILNPAKIYPGCWIQANIHPWPYDNNSGKGISFQINAARFARDDEPFAGRKKQSAEEMFGGPSGAQNPANYAPNPATMQGQAPSQIPGQNPGFQPPAAQNQGFAGQSAPLPTQMTPNPTIPATNPAGNPGFNPVPASNPAIPAGQQANPYPTSAPVQNPSINDDAPF